jgi:hypothetical protein
MAMPKKSPWVDVNLLQKPEAQVLMSQADPEIMAELLNPKKPVLKVEEKPSQAQPEMVMPESDPMADWETATKESIQERAGGIKGMQKQLDDLKGKEYSLRELDLTPAFALTDSWMKTDLASKYKAPDQMSKDEQVKAKLEDAIARQKNDVTDDMIKLLKDKSDHKLALDNARQGRFEESLTLKKEDNIRKDVNKITDEYNSVQSQLNMADQAVRSGDTRGVMMVVSSIARNVGDQKGALSDGDVARTMPPDVATNVAQLQAYLGSNPKISPELQGAFMNLINNARAKSDAIRSESVARRRAQYSAGAYSPLMSEGRVGDVIFKEAERGSQSIRGMSDAPQMSGGVADPKSWLDKKRSAKAK